MIVMSAWMLFTGIHLSSVSVVAPCFLPTFLLLQKHQLHVNSSCVLVCVFLALYTVQLSLPSPSFLLLQQRPPAVCCSCNATVLKPRAVF